jgi:uncharacterized tellurite resistance protein B-like protein
MLNFLKQFFNDCEQDLANSTRTIPQDKKIQIATCAIFIEIANADDNVTEEERLKIISVMKEAFNLSNEEAGELIELAQQAVDKSVSVYEFTDQVNANFSFDEKYEILKSLWHLIYIDKQLDKYEDFLIKRIGNNLKFDHREIMGAKLLVKDELGL